MSLVLFVVGRSLAYSALGMLGIGLLILVLPGASAQMPPADCAGFVPFVDDFESDTILSGPFPTHEQPKLTWANWQVLGDGTVDFYTTQDHIDFTAGDPSFRPDGANQFVDLDGSTNRAGFLYRDLPGLPTGAYTVQYELAGSQRAFSPTDTVDVYLMPSGSMVRPFAGGSAATVTSMLYPWSSKTASFTIAAAGNHVVGFQNGPHPPALSQNAGALLDDVQLTCAIRNPVASFTAASPGTCQDSLVSFTDTSVTRNGLATATWSWTFGDGGMSDLQNPTHQYTTAGPFTVTLTVTDSDGRVGSASQVVNSVGDPNCCPVLDPIPALEGTEGLLLSYLATASDFESDPLTFSLGPGSPSGTAMAVGGQFSWTPALGTAGAYMVPMRVSDGCIVSQLVQITVHPDTPPVASFTAAPANPQAGAAVSFDDRSTDSDPGDFVAAWTWTFGDGTTSAQASPLHIYANPGTYTACLSVRDSVGLASVKPYCLAVTVRVQTGAPQPPPDPVEEPEEQEEDGPGDESLTEPLAVDAGNPQAIGPGHLVTLAGSVEGAGATFQWVQERGPLVALSGATTPTPSFTAPEAGLAGVTLCFRLDGRAGDRTGADTVTVTVRDVNGSPVAAIDGPAQAVDGTQVVLSGAGSTDPDGDDLTFTWTQVSGPPVDVDDLHGRDAAFVMPPGDVVLLLLVSDGRASATVHATVESVPAPTEGRSDALAFDAVVVGQRVTVTPTTAGASFTWEFGDGSPPVTTPGPAVHTYGQAGTFQITLSGAGAEPQTGTVHIDAAAARPIATSVEGAWAGGLFAGAALALLALIGVALVVRRRRRAPPA